MNKKVIAMISAGVVVLILAGAAIFTALKLQDSGTQSVAPNAPESKPKAQAAPSPTGSPLQLTFSVTNTAASSSATPTASPTTTAAPTSTAVATTVAAATSSPRATTSSSKSSSSSAVTTETLPQAGMELPTIMMVIGGGILLLVGIVLAS